MDQNLDNTEKNVRDMPPAGLCRVFLALAVLCAGVSPAVGVYTPFIMAASVLAGVAALTLFGRKPISLVPASAAGAAASVGVACLFIPMLGFRFSFFLAAGFVPCTLILVLCVLKMRRRGLTVSLIAVSLSLIYALSMVLYVLDEYGALNASVFTRISSALLEQMTAYVRQLASGVTEELSDADTQAYAETLMRYTAALSPGIVYAVMYACAYPITGVFRRILMGFSRGRRMLSAWVVENGVPMAAAFLVSAFVFGILSLVAAFTDAYAVEIMLIASLNMTLITLPPNFVIGGRRLLNGLRLRLPQAFVLAAVLIVSVCCSPVMIFAMLALLGALGTVSSDYIAKHRPGADGSAGPDGSGEN